MNIAAIAWADSSGGGVVSRDAAAMATEVVADLATLVERLGGTRKYLNQLDPEARICLAAACHGLGAIPKGSARGVTALLASGYEGWLDACRAYFDDYARHGRLTGRGSLFVRTLPTTPAAQISLALKLTGPLLHFDGDGGVAQLLAEAESVVTGSEADTVLTLYSDGRSSVCWVLDGISGACQSSIEQLWHDCPSASALATRLKDLARNGGWPCT